MIYIVSCIVLFMGILLMLLLLSVGGGVSLWSHHRPYTHLPHVSHCRTFDPRDRRSFSQGWAGGQEEDSGFRPAPSRGHSQLFIIDLFSVMENDKNLGSLLPACCCCKAHTSTESSLYSSSPSELLYIVITLFGTSCLYLFLVALFLLGTHGLAANLGVFSRSNLPPL